MSNDSVNVRVSCMFYLCKMLASFFRKDRKGVNGLYQSSRK